MAYHVDVYKKTEAYKSRFQELYGNNIQWFSLEKIMDGAEEIIRMIDFTNIPHHPGIIDDIMKTFDTGRVEQSKSKSGMEKEIENLLNN